MLLDECFMYDYGLVDATEEASDKKDVSDEMCEKALEVGAAELELVEAKANQKEAKEAVEATTGKKREALREEHKTATSIVIKAEKALKKLNIEFKITLEAWKKVVGLGQGELEVAFEDEAKISARRTTLAVSLETTSTEPWTSIVESIHALLHRLDRTFAGMGNRTHREECLLRRVAVIGNRRAAAANAAFDAVPAKR